MKSALTAILCVAMVYAACIWLIADKTREKQLEETIREQGWAEVSPATIATSNSHAKPEAATYCRAISVWRLPSAVRRRKQCCAASYPITPLPKRQGEDRR